MFSFPFFTISEWVAWQHMKMPPFGPGEDFIVVPAFIRVSRIGAKLLLLLLLGQLGLPHTDPLLCLTGGPRGKPVAEMWLQGLSQPARWWALITAVPAWGQTRYLKVRLFALLSIILAFLMAILKADFIGHQANAIKNVNTVVFLFHCFLIAFALWEGSWCEEGPITMKPAGSKSRLINLFRDPIS